MGTTLKIATGLGVLAGISYLGRKRLDMESLSISAKAGGIVGYLKGLQQGFVAGIKAMFNNRRTSSI